MAGKLKENILESWIMVEHLSEGDFNIKDKTNKTFASLQDGNYYRMLQEEIKKKKLLSLPKSGVVVYFNIFPFEKVITLLREQYRLSALDEEIAVGDKFSFALYFDKNLKLNGDMTFLTASYYILSTRQVSKEKEFTKFEEDNKKKIEELFETPEDADYETFFNQAFSKLIKEYKLDTDQCRMRVVPNIETNATNLHSFFTKDLEKAKTISTANLDAYLLGRDRERQNLDSRKDSEGFNPQIFRDILQPSHYPVARFPSNPSYALSFMQQVAVILSIGYDNEQIRSVNGPPGTGKTTLLKDIFAQLIVEQTVEFANRKSKTIEGSEATRYYKNASIGQLPDSISEKEIVVASSNNGAVQNIVNELPLFSGIDKSFAQSLRKADYFQRIANTKVKSEWVTDENGKRHEELSGTVNEDADQYWGLFSLEGGKKENMDYILTVLKHVVQYLEQEYVPDEDSYRRFNDLYKEVCQYREKRQNAAKRCELDQKYQGCDRNLKRLEDEKSLINQGLVALKLQKPCFFAGRKVKTEYKQKQQEYAQQLSQIIEEERKWQKQESTLGDQIRECERVLGKDSQGFVSNPLDMSLDYDSLQKSNPWFDEEYRQLQSRLFIAALEARKQFLYDNRKNVKAAYNIWSRQKEFLEKKELIAAAWHWINMVIPVISSTFASFSHMCANLEPETLGHLFVDEAGQALPQAGVGAIFRSRHVMVVGDPAQIQPVLTLDSAILRMLGEYFGVSEEYLSASASVQTLVDAASQYGFYKDMEQKEWIGIPLWVHRRCKYPMFDIANRISYGGNMVQGTAAYGKAQWYDIGGSANNKYVEEQGEFLKEKIDEMIKLRPEIIDKSEKDIIYVITPFKNVAYHLSQVLNSIGFTRYDHNGKPTNVGTVHTFQGKEAPIVFLVLGADDKSSGAARWAVGTDHPNIMNVAATRAKEEFYIIGDQKLYLQLKSDVINETFRVISDYNQDGQR